MSLRDQNRLDEDEVSTYGCGDEDGCIPEKFMRINGSVTFRDLGSIDGTNCFVYVVMK